ncbi:MAG: hypothetical protein BGO78_17620 [Chloroflexi bacterium 44-23]|nr:MAG: hypothetical protein BGO78_17620 [Chloroflexi bacterium 44-23]
MEEKEAIKDAFTELAPRYEKVVDNELHKFWGWSYYAFIDNLIYHTPTINGDRILDVATGTGLIPRKLIADKRNANITGIDITLAMLKNAQKITAKEKTDKKIGFTAGDAMLMPFRSNNFDLVMSGLATHHMNVPKLLSEILRVLKEGGRFSLADVGGASIWGSPIFSFFIKILAYIYFFITENKDRAWAEATAVANIYTKEGWQEVLTETGFTDIRITKLESKNIWVPDPLLIQANKPYQIPGEEIK